MFDLIWNLRSWLLINMCRWELEYAGMFQNSEADFGPS